MKQSIILPESFYLSASSCGFECSESMIEHVYSFLSYLEGLEFSLKGKTNGFFHILNGELIPVGETKDGWDYLVLEWEKKEKRLKLYDVTVRYGCCLIAASSKKQVLRIIKTSEWLKKEFSDLSGNMFSDEDITAQWITENEGYTVEGKPGILISY